jgi:hypothetical protein
MRLLDWEPDMPLDKLFTQDPSATPVHAIPWNLVGETWPYFRPNFNAMEEYAAKYAFSSTSPSNVFSQQNEAGCRIFRVTGTTVLCY